MSYSAYAQQQAAAAAGPDLVFASRRSPVYGVRGMVSCSQPLAAEAGLRILQAGGNAADAAVAVAAALGVTEPCSTGAGGDAFGLFYDAATRRVSCLQGNGAAPAALTVDAVRAVGVAGPELPRSSALCVTVPGAVKFWEDSLAAWGSGRLTLGDVLAPAIELAEGGFPVAPLTAAEWAKGAPLIAQQGGPGARALVDAAGAGPKAGQLWRNPDLAATLRRIGQFGAAAGFYSGPIAEAVVAALRDRGGVMTLQDLAEHRTQRVEPLSTEYRGHVVWEVPPPTAGIVTLMALNILAAHDDHTQQQQQQQQQQPEAGGASNGAVHGNNSTTSSSDRQAAAAKAAAAAAGDAEQMHVAIEACRLAFADALAWVADPLVHASLPVLEMVSRQRAAQRYRDFFSPAKACHPVPCEQLAAAGQAKRVHGGDTCQWVVVDGGGNAASYIQSNYMGFGSGIVPEGCGFSLQNRGHGFTLAPGHPNSLAPGARPYHTIMPGMLTHPDGRLAAAFGCMGGYMQPQGHLQLLVGLLQHGLDPQAALDVPRFCVDRLDSAVGPASAEDSHVLLEEGVPDEVVAALAAKGHGVRVVRGHARSVFGKGAIIMRDAGSGVLCGGFDPRGDGCVAAW